MTFGDDGVSCSGVVGGGVSRWGLGSVALGVVLFLVLSFVAAIVVGMIGVFVFGFSEVGDFEGLVPLQLMFGGVAMLVSFVGFPWLVSRLWGVRSLRRDFGLWFRWVDLLLGGGVAVVSFIGGVVWAFIFSLFLGEIPQGNTGGLISGVSWVTFGAVFFAVVLVAPFAEELFFRGLVLRALGRRFGLVVGVLGSALLFGLLHVGGVDGGGWVSVVFVVCATTTFGLVAGVVAGLSGRLGGVVVGHVLVNAVVFVTLVVGAYRGL